MGLTASAAVSCVMSFKAAHVVPDTHQIIWQPCCSCSHNLWRKHWAWVLLHMSVPEWVLTRRPHQSYSWFTKIHSACCFLACASELCHVDVITDETSFWKKLEGLMQHPEIMKLMHPFCDDVRLLWNQLVQRVTMLHPLLPCWATCMTCLETVTNSTWCFWCHLKTCDYKFGC